MFHQLILESNGVQVITKVLKISTEFNEEELRTASTNILDTLSVPVTETALNFAENSRKRGFISIEEACLLEVRPGRFALLGLSDT